MPLFSDFERPDWSREGAGWPNRAASRFVQAGGLRWHVQIMGEGPPLLLVHGTGAATHSWRDVAPLLAHKHMVIAPDLPGHGFTQGMAWRDVSLAGMAKALRALLVKLEVAPLAAVGHSAGAAILIRLALDGALAPRALIALNGALLPFEGMAGQIFPPMAKLLFANPLAPRIFAWSADAAAVRRLLEGTGSKIDARGIELYTRLFRVPGHVAGALAMMANWDLESFSRGLAKMRAPLTLVTGLKDLAIAPGAADKAKALMPQARIEKLPGLGHLAHEEAPDTVAALILRLAAEAAGDAPC